MKNKLKTGAILTTTAVGLLHVLNKCISAVSTLKDLLPSSDGRYFTWRFGKVYYEKTGTGSPLLLIHDLSPYASSYEWSLLRQKLSKTHTVYTLDLLGCGRSDKPNMTYTNYLYVQLISDFIEKVITEKTDVVVTGLSSSFVVMACGNNPDLFNKLLMINPENLVELASIPGKRSKMTKFLMDMPIIGTTLYHILSSRDNIEYLFTEKYFYNPFRVKSKQIQVYYESAHKGDSCGKYLLSSINGNYVNINISNALKNINNSIFVLLGTHYENAKLIADSYTKMNPAIETVFLDDTKFLPQLEAPELTCSNITLFLES
ncbi:MAG: alpha/beta fold hydrolase [Eubacteriales bacterium]|nr:alpha/beta fold hydrolase [Eubacteriales bacterium]